MTAQTWVPVVAACALAAWLLVLYRVRSQLRHSELMPDSVREGALVAVYAACIGGTVASLGFVQAVGPEIATILAIAWRASVLVAGIYALIGSAMAGRAD